MYRTSSTVNVSWFRHTTLIWGVLLVMLWSYLPVVSWAQQPTATINTMSGTVLVNNQQQGTGTVLRTGDIIETQVGATMVLELSDGSLLEVGENTKLDVAVLSRTAAGARVSKMKLLWGRIRAALSPEHQHAGSSFDIETPNALVGVKFSQPDVEVSYDPAKQETVALALTVALAVKNFVTDEEKIIPIGSIAIITALGIQVMGGAATTGAIATETTGTGAADTLPTAVETTETITPGTETVVGAAETTTAADGAAETAAATGMSTGTKIAIGAGAVLAAGGVAALAASGDDGDGGGTGDSSGTRSFTGIFMATFVGGAGDAMMTHIFDLTQNGTSVTGTFDVTWNFFSGCTGNVVVPVTGTTSDTTATLSWPRGEDSTSCGICIIRAEPGVTATLHDNGRILRLSDANYDYIRQ